MNLFAHQFSFFDNLFLLALLKILQFLNLFLFVVQFFGSLNILFHLFSFFFLFISLAPIACRAIILFNEHINYHENFERDGYHDTEDTIDLIDFEYGQTISQYAIATVSMLAHHNKYF